MREQYTEIENLPFVARDRRRIPDRRAKWRGGRRDSDWTHRRPVSYATLTGLSPVRRWGPLSHGSIRRQIRAVFSFV
jgi:hypothetical protein